MTNPEPKAADVPSASTDEVRAWDTAMARKPAADGLREALERLAGHDTRDPGLTYDNPEQLVQSAAQAAKDILAALASPSIEGQAGEESKEWSLACTLAGAELNYRNSYEQRGAYHIETGRRWDKMRCAGDAIRTHEPASVSPQDGGAGLDWTPAAIEAGARAMAACHGVDPDDLAPRTTMCTADNQRVPWWKVFEEEAEACINAIRSLAPKGDRPATGWQRIETAPRDGTRILARGGALDDIEVVAYSPNVGAWATPHYTLDDRDDEPDGYNRPRFWMPLPAVEPLGATVTRAERSPE